jgi:hypothetical protein
MTAKLATSLLQHFRAWPGGTPRCIPCAVATPWLTGKHARQACCTDLRAFVELVESLHALRTAGLADDVFEDAIGHALPAHEDGALENNTCGL